MKKIEPLTLEKSNATREIQQATMTRTMSDNYEINVMLSDFGEEIDDEVALFCAMMTSSNATWYVVCVPGASSSNPENANEEIRKRMTRVKTLFPCFESVRQKTRSTTNATISISETMKWTNQQNATFIVGPPSMICDHFHIQDNNKHPHIIDNLIRIAPLWHMDPEYFDQFPLIKNYIVMGDLSNPTQSINLTKAIPEDNEALKLQYENQEYILSCKSEKILSIPTSLARKVALPYELLNKLPECLKNPLLNTAFEQCVGRVPSHLVFANNISVVNHSTILNYCSQEEKYDIVENNGENVIPGEVVLKIKRQVKMFLENASSNDKADETYVKRLEDIAMAIWLVTGVEYYDVDCFKTFNKDNLEDTEMAKQRWFEVIDTKNSNLTPCYDLLAIIVKEKGYVPYEEECQSLVKSFLT